MTCVVGLIHDGQIWLGADSAGVAGLGLEIRADEKVFEHSGFVFGFTTSFRMGQILRYAFSPPKCETWDVRRYMSTDFIRACRKAFDDEGFGGKRTNGEAQGGTFIVGHAGQLFVIHGDYQVAVPSAPFAAVGCGEDLALGSLFSTQGEAPEDRIRCALGAAERYSAGVRAPFHIVRLPAPPRPERP